jgi:hypothetical protein
VRASGKVGGWLEKQLTSYSEMRSDLMRERYARLKLNQTEKGKKN